MSEQGDGMEDRLRSRSDVRDLVIDGEWRKSVTRDTSEYGEYRREPTRFRNEVRNRSDARHPAVADRYHLYISRACPWAHRTAITRRLKGLEDAVSLSLVEPERYDEGWEFSDTHPDPLYGYDYLRELYVHADPEYTGRVTVPVLWDTETETIVNNESEEIMRMLDTEFHHLANGVDLYPDDRRDEIDRVIDAIYPAINNGVYRAGFAGSQRAYDEAVAELFDALDHWDSVLAGQRYLVGSRLTEADVAMFPTLVRFDHVYHTHFKCNQRAIHEFDNLWGYTKDIYQTPGVPETVNLDHVVRHYYRSHDRLNPKGIVPIAPDVDFTEPHLRNSLQGSPPLP